MENKDPCAILRQYLIKKNGCDEKMMLEIEEKIDADLKTAFQEARKELAPSQYLPLKKLFLHKNLNI